MKMKKSMGFIDLFCMSSGAMISSGLFILPGLVYFSIGPASIIAYVIASIMVIPAVFSQSELCTAMPKSGGTYFFIDRSMGAALGTLGGLSNWISLSLKTAFALLGIGSFAVLIYPDVAIWQIKLIAVCCCLFFLVLNYFSTKHASRLQNFLVVGLIIILAWYIGGGISHVKVPNLHPFLKGSFRDFFAAAGLVFISYGGLTKIASVAEEVKNPGRNIPLSMISALIVVSLIYVLAVFVTVGVVGPELINADGIPTRTPLSDSATLFMGEFGQIMLACAAILAFVSTGNAGLMAASRAPMAMSRDKLMPNYFAELHPKHGTPARSLIVTSFIMIVAIVSLPLETLVKVASTLMILLFASVNVAVIIMRESGIQNYRPKFKSPFYPWIQIAGIIGYLFLLVEMGLVPLMITGIFLGLGLLWYWAYGRIHANRKSAMVHLVERVAPPQLNTQTLHAELKEILQERDEIVEDRFDQIIKEAPVLDLDQCSLDKMMKYLADGMAERCGLTSDVMEMLLTKREQESSTNIAPGLAIPHIIIPGKEKFRILLARSKEGISFSADGEPVHAIFLLAGTADERNYHLRVLMSIAQIVQNSTFMDKWLKAKSREALRDIVLLSDRNRL